MKVLVIAAHGLSLGYLGCYGNPWIATPSLDQLAAEGAVFDQHYADQPNPDGAVRAWRSGHSHFPGPASSAAHAEGTADLLTLLHNGGIATMRLVVGRSDSTDSFYAGWDLLQGVETYNAAAVDLLLERNGARERWLFWVDLDMLQPPWQVPEPFAAQYFQGPAAEDEEDEPEDLPEEEELTPLPDPVAGLMDLQDDITFLRLQRTYAGAVSYLDAIVGDLLETLRGRGLLEEMLVVVTSDRGTPLGEHGVVLDGRPWLHDELIHLPLLVRLPHSAEAGLRIGALTQAVDLFPTLLDAFGLSVPECHGRSLHPLLQRSTDQIRAYACVGLTEGGATEWCLRSPEWSFLLPIQTTESSPREPQLYVKPEDRGEVNNVLQHHQELAELLEKTLRGFVQATQQPGPLSPPELRANEPGSPPTTEEQ
jgi:arylsulfatase A-like enzyme